MLDYMLQNVTIYFCLTSKLFLFKKFFNYNEYIILIQRISFLFQDTQKAFDDFKKRKKVHEVMFFWYVKVWLSKTVCGIFHFWFRFVFIKVYIFFQQIVTHCFPSRPLISKLQQEVLKFIDFCVCWSSPKTNPVTNFLNFINVFISLIEFKKNSH